MPNQIGNLGDYMITFYKEGHKISKVVKNLFSDTVKLQIRPIIWEFWNLNTDYSFNNWPVFFYFLCTFSTAKKVTWKCKKKLFELIFQTKADVDSAWFECWDTKRMTFSLGFYCCKQSLKRLYHPSTHSLIHPSTHPQDFLLL